MKEIKPEQWNKNVFETIGKQWMLITSGEEKANTMTASWGGLGILWGKPVAYVFIRPQRYTKEFVDSCATFSLSFLGEEYREQLQYLGRVSGREEDKILKSGLHLIRSGKTPYFEESESVLICEKMYRQSLDPNSFLIDSETWYSNRDYHDMYIAEIQKILVRS